MNNNSDIFDQLVRLNDIQNKKDMDEIKDYLYLVKSENKGETLFDILKTRMSVKRAFMEAISLQKLYKKIFGIDKFDNFEWLQIDSTKVIEYIKRNKNNIELEGLHALVTIVDIIKDKDLIHKYMFIEEIID